MPAETYVTFLSVRIQAGKMDEAIAVFKDELLPMARKQKDYRGSSLLVDRRKNEASVVSRWEAARKEKTAQHGPELLPRYYRRLRGIVSERHRPVHYEIVVEDRPRSARRRRSAARR